jgi:proteasome lid subunit RPN8/RPN11
MTRWLELFRGRNRDYYARMELEPMLYEAVVREMTQDGRADVPLAVAMVREPDRGTAVSNPEIVNVDPLYGSVVVIAHRSPDDATGTDGAGGEKSHVRHRYLSELLGPYLQEQLSKSAPGEQYWEFRISRDGADNLRRPAPVVDMTVEVEVGRPRVRQARIRRVAGPELTGFDPAAHTVDPADLHDVNVVLTPQVHEQLARTLPLSDLMETGGFLAGSAHTIAGRPGAHLVRISRVIPAESTGASPTQFTFTPDSFVELTGLLDADSGEVLLGWYHSHLFSAAGRMILSLADIGLHFRTFQRPFQVAGLINYTHRERTVRFFARRGDEMVECPQWVEDESAQCRLERPGSDPR